ncbi:glycosyltransferase involved in cell wall biosynthesis [Paenibacillus rhizosphaerae]|uniref:Glycosyltransferase involved in cell wall biosynthesis n=1 Tax=Paenibacillus rhizosphaerae TaxID=297318 RepID=A0A839U4D1_9BACL|nr:glycosyltransferase family 4 protein [Paenibacillus rhizosphaerae]MBB3131717.1 glycosyltransferase involved in cell wall biosynthesis [Paenibacillus rhizosphaerae]
MDMTKPKLMLFSHVSNTKSITGAEKLLLLFCRFMSPYFNCILVAPGEGKLTDHARKQGIQVMIQTFPLLYGMYNPDSRLPQNAEELRSHPDYASVVRLIGETAPDLVLTNTIVNALPAIAAKSLGIPVVWKVTEVIQENEFTTDVLNIADFYSDWIISISESAARVFLGKISSPISLLPPSTDSERLHSFSEMVRQSERKGLRLKEEHKCIGYISAFIHPEKGLKEFIRMAISLCPRRPECRFVIVGRAADHRYYDACLTDVRFSGYKSRFQFIPFVESVQSVYSAMDILVVPSMVSEGFGMTALEGMLCGKPVVAFASGGLGELMVSTGNGHLAVPAGDSQGLADKVAGLLDDPAALANTGFHNEATARAMYGIETYQRRLDEIINQWRTFFPHWLMPGNRAPLTFAEPEIPAQPPIEPPEEPAPSRRKVRRSRGRTSYRIRIIRKRRVKKAARRPRKRKLVKAVRKLKLMKSAKRRKKAKR